jgi:arabinose-5-phosphate isomerase
MIRDALSRVLAEEAQAIVALADRQDPSFELAVNWFLECKGRVVTCGLGKSGHIARKTAATLASTGTAAFFLHAAEAIHGDLGMVSVADVVLVYSYSGETEVVQLMPSFKREGAKTIAMTGRTQSTLAKQADLVLDVSVPKEACPHNLAPTTSTTLMLAASDALAVATMEARGFTREDFARYHPAGALGKRLTLTVRDVMRKGEDLPLVGPTAPLVECLAVVGQKGAGGAVVVDDEAELLGYFTDGDLRRWIIKGGSLDVLAGAVAITHPRTIEPDMLAFEALEFFENLPMKLGELPVVEGGAVVGLLVLKDLIRAGLI